MSSLIDFTKDELITYIQSIIGDTPVSEQLSAALEQMASKTHSHDDCVSRSEYEALKKEVDMLSSLVGDISVSEQINTAIDRIKQ